ncbi:MAG: YncE family protein [Chthoniobacterales bacterium]
MKSSSFFCVIAVLLVFGSVVAAEPHYQKIGEIPIGGEGGWDILTIDSAARRLYLSHATKVVVVDIDKGNVVSEIADTPGVHQFIAIPELNRGFSSNGKEDKVGVIDLKTGATTSKLDTGKNPDAMVYSPKRGQLYVGNHTGKSATVIDVKQPKAIATVPLDGEPEFSVADDAADRIYCNIEDKSAVAVIDAAKHQVMTYWPLEPGKSPTGIALDAAHHRLFAACENLLVMCDTTSGKVVATVPTGRGADGCAFDDETGLIFVPCGEGVTTIAKETTEGLTVIDNIKTERGARTIALDPKTHRIFMPTAQFEPPAPSVASPARPRIVPNTQKLLVYGPAEGR